MLDYRIHYAQLVNEDRLRTRRVIEPVRPAVRVQRRESPRSADTAARR
jgi:hypothetical protein